MSAYQDNDQMDSPSEINPGPGTPAVGRDGARRQPRNDEYDDDGGDRGRYYDDYADDDNEYYEDDPRRRNNERGEYADDGYDDRYDDDDGPYEEGDFFEEDFDDDERERKARDMARKKRKPTKVYEVEDGIVRDDLNDEYGPETTGMTRRDYWGRERKNCCDCIRLCCLSCCRGFRTPPACEPRRLWYVTIESDEHRHFLLLTLLLREWGDSRRLTLQQRMSSRMVLHYDGRDSRHQWLGHVRVLHHLVRH
jgi:hypothetical protein